jgi:F-type H+-transporting ATPase subunit b
VKPTEVSKCVEEKVANGEQPDQCVKADNPILPAKNELIWGIISFVALFALMAKFAVPAVQKSMQARTERIRENLDDAERLKTEASTILEDYQRQLADARNESNRIIEEARQTADQLRRDLMARAEAEVNELKQRTTEDIQAMRERTMADLRSEVANLAIELAEKVVEKNLDRDTNIALIDSFIAQVGSR